MAQTQAQLLEELAALKAANAKLKADVDAAKAGQRSDSVTQALPKEVAGVQIPNDYITFRFMGGSLSMSLPIEGWDYVKANIEAAHTQMASIATGPTYPTQDQRAILRKVRKEGSKARYAKKV